MSVKMQLGLLMFGTIGSMLLVSVSCKNVYVVGDKLGWNIPSQTGFFDDWAKNKTFVVGDELLFQYHPGLNTVVMVDKEDYENCATMRIIRSFINGNSPVVLDKPGDNYFFSSIGKHCENGVKLHIVVADQPKSSN
ncbi:hypothetical protein PHAVU_002G295800 [Phaseolus vulgaris]|uniref:Phytocyanin domain-containing protein n=2 Tax=Phaseolus vulgaris TaxID=3885 RepID=V7CPK2_PHAVU|nr:hypothetical protein PHAVU_002G295800g [Phaseolus vulgaris]ESW32132.1 hypothetical protein PHAVU_002G295800g [Phaseolus vulgaris]